MTMREKIARALMGAIDPDENWQTIGDEEKQYLSSLADAVLDAMREPTPGMMRAAAWKDGREMWEAMIDAAKGETR